MHSLEPELRTLQREGVLDDAAAGRAIAIERRTVFSIFLELRVALYVAVAAITTGIGIFLQQNRERIGPLGIILGLAAVAAACYVVAVRLHRRAIKPSLAAGSVLMLGALIASADLGYAETQFHWFGADWSRHLLILAVAHAVTAYALESPLVLSLAITSFAAWSGVERSFGNLWTLEYAAPGAGERALACAAFVFGWREIHRRLRGSLLLQEAMDHCTANLAFWGGLAWCASEQRRVAGLIVVLALGAAVIRHGRRHAREVFVIYGVLYGAIALCIVEGTLQATPLLAVFLRLATVVGSAGLLWRLHAQAKDAAA